MKHKFLMALLAIVSTLCMAFGFAGCGETSNASGSIEGIYYAYGDSYGLITKGEQRFELKNNKLNYIEPSVQSLSVAVFGPSSSEEEPVTVSYRVVDQEIIFTNNQTKEEIKGTILADGIIKLTQKPIDFYLYKEGTGIVFDEESSLAYLKNPGTDTCFVICTDMSKIKTEVVIPSTFGDWRVTGIGTRAFRRCDALKITIPNGVTSIGDYAFYACHGLTSIEIPDSVTTIGFEAFQDCIGLSRIKIPNGVTSIGANVFEGCSGLTLEIGNIINSIGDLNSISGHCFDLTVKLSDDVTSIDDRVFASCSQLVNIEIPDSVTTIGNYAFSGCTELTSIEIPNSVTSIGDRAFEKVEMTSIRIPDNVTSIGEGAFGNCIKLTSVSIGKGLTSIGQEMFTGCYNLTNIEIPNSVTSIGHLAFADCTNLTSITFLGTMDEWKAISKSSGWQYKSGITQVVCNNGTLTGEEIG